MSQFFVEQCQKLRWKVRVPKKKLFTKWKKCSIINIVFNQIAQSALKTLYFFEKISSKRNWIMEVYDQNEWLSIQHDILILQVF